MGAVFVSCLLSLVRLMAPSGTRCRYGIVEADEGDVVHPDHVSAYLITPCAVISESPAGQFCQPIALTLGRFASSLCLCLSLSLFAVITAATRSVNLAPQSTKTQIWKGSCQDPIPPEFQDKVTLTLSCLGGHQQIHGDTEPSPVVLGEQGTMEKTTQRFQKMATTLADLNAEGLNVQTVNDLLTMYVGAASQHVLRMSFVPEQEAQNFDRQVLTFWSRLMHRDITSQLFFLPLKLGGFGVGSAVQRHAAAPWRAWQSVIPSLMTTTQSPDTDSLFRSTQIRQRCTWLRTT